uniref:Uncharacterized protein n=1 Tax=Parascaris univalens TaxID=6257 RepID=A0A915ADE0_PARUN
MTHYKLESLPRGKHKWRISYNFYFHVKREETTKGTFDFIIQCIYPIILLLINCIFLGNFFYVIIESLVLFSFFFF